MATTDPALSARTFLRNPTLSAALGQIATMTPKPIISGAEVDGSDDQPEPTPIVILFTNRNPSAYDSLGEISWQCVNPHCPECDRDLREVDVYFKTHTYDGCNWENPACVYCGTVLQGEPVDPNERTARKAK